MNTEEKATLQRKLRRVRDAATGRMSEVAQASLNLLDPMRSASVRASLISYRSGALKEASAMSKAVSAETISFVQSIELPLDEASIEAVLASAAEAINQDSLLGKMTSFEEAVVRHMSRYGVRVNIEDHRPDLTRAEYSAGIANSCRASLAALKDELHTILLRQSRISHVPPPNKPSKLEAANEIVKLEPNFFGIGLNLNKVLYKCLRRK